MPVGIFKARATRQKPQCGSQLDRGHPLSGGLAACWLFNEMGGLEARDLASNNHLTLPSSTTVSYAATGGATGLKCATISTATPPTTRRLITTGTTFAIETRFWAFTFGDSYEGLIVQSGTPGLYLRSTGLADYYFSGDHQSSTAMSANRWNHLVLSVQGGNGTFYVNGVADGTMASVVSANLSLVGRDATSQNLNAQLEYLRVWVGRSLTPSDVLNLYAEPYAMLRPVVRRVYSISSGTVGNPYYWLLAGRGVNA